MILMSCIGSFYDYWMVSNSIDRKSTRLNSSHSQISYAVFCLKKKKNVHCDPFSNPSAQSLPRSYRGAVETEHSAHVHCRRLRIHAGAPAQPDTTSRISTSH